MMDVDMLKLVNAVQGTGLAVAWHQIKFHLIEEPAHVPSAPRAAGKQDTRSGPIRWKGKQHRAAGLPAGCCNSSFPPVLNSFPPTASRRR